MSVATAAAGRLIRAEFRLTGRDPFVLTFVFAFPVITMLIIGGAFGTEPDPGGAHEYIGNDTLVCHNAGFDTGVIRYACAADGAAGHSLVHRVAG